MTTIMKLCAGDLIDTDNMFVLLFDFRETRVFRSDINADGIEKSAFANAGYESSIFFMLLGTIFFLLILYAIYLAIRKLLKLATSKCSDNFLTRRLRTEI